jgi:hypothetical protein|tara:strand:- start:2617 stop:3159 length:543 start_codon:yes stop_codon:yes gene_type:complete
MKEENIEYAIEYRKGSAWNEREGSIYKWMECKRCGQMAKCSEDSQSITCSDCVNELVGPVETSYVKSDKPRGWTLMKQFVDKDGNVYNKGVEVPELKGTISKTEKQDRKKSERMTKSQKEELMTTAALNLHKLKKQLAKTRWKKDKKPILSEIKLHSKVASAKFPRNFNREEYLNLHKSK